MSEELKQRAETRLAEALAAMRLADPRGHYRSVLVRLRQRDREAFEKARRHYDEHVLARTADTTTDALAEWIDYGRFLAGLLGRGDIMEVAPDGRASSYQGTLRDGALLLYIPDDPAEPVFVLIAPSEPTPPQQATLELLVG